MAGRNFKRVSGFLKLTLSSGFAVLGLGLSESKLFVGQLASGGLGFADIILDEQNVTFAAEENLRSGITEA